MPVLSSQSSSLGRLRFTQLSAWHPQMMLIELRSTLLRNGREGNAHAGERWLCVFQYIIEWHQALLEGIDGCLRPVRQMQLR